MHEVIYALIYIDNAFYNELSLTVDLDSSKSEKARAIVGSLFSKEFNVKGINNFYNDIFIFATNKKDEFFFEYSENAIDKSYTYAKGEILLSSGYVARYTYDTHKEYERTIDVSVDYEQGVSEFCNGLDSMQAVVRLKDYRSSSLIYRQGGFGLARGGSNSFGTYKGLFDPNVNIVKLNSEEIKTPASCTENILKAIEVIKENPFKRESN